MAVELGGIGGGTQTELADVDVRGAANLQRILRLVRSLEADVRTEPENTGLSTGLTEDTIAYQTH